ncbi:transposase domain-containing protein [Streptomyces sp. NPDC002596]
MFAPVHLGELTQVVDFALVDAVLEETDRREKRLRLLPSRVVVYFVLALALFENRSYRTVWSKLTTALTPLAMVRPAGLLADAGQAQGGGRTSAAPARAVQPTWCGSP